MKLKIALLFGGISNESDISIESAKSIINIIDKNKYDEIINISHFDPVNHKRMSMTERAAQFSPFAALTGYDDAIRETSQKKEEEMRASEEMEYIPIV